ncbi:hypothetical protein F5Y10DRAFT_247987 [Nemania abortiva]|nr:hypothetical protein F5Y10DRAFT_247987 [Nemania abortiva]
MPPLPYRFLLARPAQHWSPFQPTDPSPYAHTSYAIHLLVRSKASSRYRYGQSNGPQTPLNGWEIAVIVIASLVGTVILFWILYHCWEQCRPRPTYYEEAVQLSEQREKSERKKTRSWPQPINRRIASMRRVHTAIVDNVTPPPAASTRSSFYSDEGERPPQ